MQIAVAPGTDQSQISIRLGIALNLPYPSVLHMGKDPAPVSTTIALRRDHFHRGRLALFFPCHEVQKGIPQGSSSYPGPCHF